MIGRLVVTELEDGTQKRGFILQPTSSVFAKNRLDDRRGCKVEELIITEEDSNEQNQSDRNSV